MELKPCPYKIIYSTNNDKQILVDVEDCDYLNKFEWKVYDRYVETFVDGKNVKMHRLLLGVEDSSIHVDHINGNQLDNRKSNIRICSRYGNQQNRKTNVNNKLGQKGIVEIPSGHYRVRVQAFGKRYDLGVYCTIEEAKNAREGFAKQMHGEFYRHG